MSEESKIADIKYEAVLDELIRLRTIYERQQASIANLWKTCEKQWSCIRQLRDLHGLSDKNTYPQDKRPIPFMGTPKYLRK